MEVDLILEKQSRKKDAFMIIGTSYVKVVLALLTEVIAIHILAFIIQVRALSYKKSISKSKVCLAMFLALKK